MLPRLALCLALFLMFSGVIGSEFLPHLDEGAIWARGTLAPSTGPTEGTRVMNQARVIFASFPEVTQVVSQVGRPDDGTDTTGFFNTEYFVDLKPKEKWRPVFHENKEELIAAMDRELEKIPGVLWNFSQPISDNMEEAVSGVKGELAIKIYGDDLRLLEARGGSDRGHHAQHPRHRRSRTVSGDRPAESEFRGGSRSRRRAIESMSRMCRTPFRRPWAAMRSARCCRASSATTWWCAIRRRIATPKKRSKIFACWRLPASAFRLRSSRESKSIDGASEIYREENSRYVAIKYSVRGRDLGSAVEEAIQKVSQQVKLPVGYHIDWAGEYESQKRSQKRLLIVVPLTILVIFIILYTMFSSVKWALLILGERGDGADRRIAGAPDYRHALQRLLGRGIPGAVRSFGANRRDHAGIHQPVARARPYD